MQVRALSEELENPLNVHRWRKLEGSDPVAYDMILKIQILQKRLILKTEQVNSPCHSPKPFSFSPALCPKFKLILSKIYKFTNLWNGLHIFLCSMTVVVTIGTRHWVLASEQWIDTYCSQLKESHL
jgi:hypothetical protein